MQSNEGCFGATSAGPDTSSVAMESARSRSASRASSGRRQIRGRPGREIRTLLAICPPWGTTSPPISLGCLSEFLLAHGKSVSVYDLNRRLCEESPKHLEENWQIRNYARWREPARLKELQRGFVKALDRCLDEMIGTQPDVIGFTVVDPNPLFTLEVSRKLKSMLPDTSIVLGGPACLTPGSRELLHCEAVDGLVVGEGERALLAIVEKLEKGVSPTGTDGVIWHGTEPDIIPAQQLESLDELPFPRYGQFDLLHYGGPALAVMWSRGCIGRCTYCKERRQWNGCRTKGPQERLREIRYHAKTCGFREFVVYDSAVNARPKLLEEFCELLARERLDVRWSAEAIPFRLDRSLLSKMKQAGCHTLVFGVESGSSAVLHAMGKLFSADEAERVLRLTSDVGIQCWINLIVGYPGETRADFCKTLDFVARNAECISRIDSLSTLQVVEGTSLHDMYKRLGVVLPEKEEYNRWYGSDGNTLELRLERLRELTMAIRSLGIATGRNFLEEN